MNEKSMESVAFAKMSGSGNDFILIDNRAAPLDEDRLEAFVGGICRRRLSVGADGVILIEASPVADFRWRFFNSDGSTAEMCGNGARCAARFAHLQGIGGPQLSFETEAGLIHARVNGRRVEVKMTDPHSLELDVPIALAKRTLVVSSINTGVPHAVMVAEQVDDLDVIGLGRTLRYHPRFAPAGTNADFICPESGGGIALRTYERGVEDETLACGTGAVAGALVAACRLGLSSPVVVRARSGEKLAVSFRRRGGQFEDVRLEGEARLIFAGKITSEAWR